jgi:hypothetical protein
MKESLSEGPEAAILLDIGYLILATVCSLLPVRPLGPVRSWVGLGVVRGPQLGPCAAGFGVVAGGP